ncbi:MAG: haloacid dehalogenase type II [Acetobacteraceae bacterium]|nr:haloacid dehalogenase type II [Acetobacteraceae bacterium]
MPANRPAPIFVFDVNETLLDLTFLEPLFARCFGDAAILRNWFAQLILYSQAMSLSGLYTPFSDLAAGALHMMGTIYGKPIGDADVAELRDRLARMPAHADAAPALARLQEAGFRLVTLTNSPPSPSPTPLERAGLGRYFERNFSVDAVGRFKPAPETYAYVARELGVDRTSLCLVACHLWDTLGAQATGCLGALLTRPHNAVLPAPGLPHPDIVAPDLADFARQVLETWPAPSGPS